MADTLETLEIEIQHSASGAAGELEAVASAISKISAALTRALPKLGKLAEALGKIGSPVTINDIHDSTFTKSVQNASNAASRANKNPENLPATPLGEDVQSQIANADKLQILLHKMAEAQERFNEAVRGGDENAAWKAREKYVNAVLQAQREYNKLAKEAEENAQPEANNVVMDNAASAIGAAQEQLALPEGLENTAEAAQDAADAIKPLSAEIQNAILNANEIDVLTAKLERLKVALAEAFASGNTDKAYELQGKILQVQSAIDRATNAANRSKAAMHGFSESTKEMSKSAERAKSPLENFVSSLKRIAFYRFIRTIIKAITQAFQEGLKNAYQFSSGMEGSAGRFAAAMDSMKAAGGTMKNQLGAAFISLLAAIAPIVNAIIGLITRLAAALSQLFGAFTGGTWLKATAGAEELADACGGGAAAAEEWKNQLMGFDEINRLEAPNDGGGGGGGGGGGVAGMFEEAELTGFFKRLHDKIEELKNSLNFEPLKDAWDKLTGAVERFLNIIEGRFWYVWDTILVPFAHWTIEEALPLLVEDLAIAFDLLSTILEKTEPYWKSFHENFVVPLMEWDFDRISEGLKSIGDALQSITDVLNGDISFEDFVSKFGEAMTKVSEFANPALRVGRELGDYFGGELRVIFEQTAQDLSDIWESIKTTWNEFVTWIEGAWNDLKTWWEERVLPKWKINIPSIEVEWQDAGALMQFFGVDKVPKLHLVWSGEFANGGFPEDGLFFANHGELVGQFSNGKTAVANNEQIIEGIKQGVIEAMMISNSGNGRGVTEVRMDVNGREFMRAVFEDGRAVANEHGISLITA